MNTLMAQGLELMLIGMGVVFSFLIILVAVTSLMSLLVKRFGQAPAVSPAATTTAAPAGDMPSPAVIKAIEKAVRQHRQSQQ
ncbi:oxaloacetate decarboxylase [Alcanivorax sp. HI0033]|jgi:oxaloacetate decarboxylase gamma subunit|uniref:OadG family protein n=1 Tax=Alcanivorax TaxID=59753 RepID=UPI0007B840ED|nr:MULTISPECIES: OadG family transporter subunit [unclassified Alcanivorax]KZX78133.1 oxaloacetate decarboxylase [Alcanivorax sp. HI0013]KZX83796.1 oxaloacetate decarboxylase [Alcanivorax sp. HI0011]KZY14072.1 oxaloacetate decarboxylase [Alcanivorax sp. HI0035]KZX69001.1 oxaloacetate decarboxylase [Alcanivorax sp. HI0003]KZX72755.1 oxaloacetate decarboxylase [Alcanivorax sp. HI0007]